MKQARGKGRRHYRALRYHRSRFDTTVCPDRENCIHTTDVVGEVCECCAEPIREGATVPAL